jgi:hypothetical protein
MNKLQPYSRYAKRCSAALAACIVAACMSGPSVLPGWRALTIEEVLTFPTDTVSRVTRGSGVDSEISINVDADGDGKLDNAQLVVSSDGARYGVWLRFANRSRPAVMLGRVQPVRGVVNVGLGRLRAAELTALCETQKDKCDGKTTLTEAVKINTFESAKTAWFICADRLCSLPISR